MLWWARVSSRNCQPQHRKGWQFSLRKIRFRQVDLPLFPKAKRKGVHVMLTMTIRPARSGDWTQLEPLIDGLCRVHGDKSGLTRRQFDMWVCRDSAPMTVLVAETEGGIIAGYVSGFALHEFHAGLTHFSIENLYVIEPMRRKRIGESLLLSIIEVARKKHEACRIRIAAESWNDTALGLYRELGFIENAAQRPTTRLFREM